MVQPASEVRPSTASRIEAFSELLAILYGLTNQGGRPASPRVS